MHGGRGCAEREEIDPASGLTWTGLWSSVHMYPAEQRFYTITSNAGRGDRTGVDVVHTPTSDGVNAAPTTATSPRCSRRSTPTLGGRFFNDTGFNLVRITLPTKVQNAVDDAHAAVAQVTQAQARVQTALTAMRLTGLPTGPVGILGSR
jgi:hypothetical protein